MRLRFTTSWVLLMGASLLLVSARSHVHATAAQQPSAAATASIPPQRALLDRYCITCHNEKLRARGTVPVSFEGLDVTQMGAHAEVWEKIVQKLRAGVMPPDGMPRPDKATYDGFRSWVEGELDRAAAAQPNPGKPTIRRLAQTEYTNAIRDVLALEVDPRSLLFPDDERDEFGFSNNGGVLSVSPALLDRYLAAARRISRLAVGDPTISAGMASVTYATHKMYKQDYREDDSPFGTRGGLTIRHYFPLDGEYGVKVRLHRQVYDYIIGMGSEQHLDVRVDGQRIARFTVGTPPEGSQPSAWTFFGPQRGDVEWEHYMSHADDPLDVSFAAKAGMRTVSVSFAKHLPEPTGVLELRRPSSFGLSGDDFYFDNAAVETVAINGPFKATGPGETPSRTQIFVCRPNGRADEAPCAKRILTALARRAYRRPVTETELETLLRFYDAGRKDAGFDTGIQFAVERILVAPAFLFRAEAEPQNVAPGTVYRLGDHELATQLALFLWSSVPDEELLTAADHRTLSDPVVLERQVRRMLADGRSKALVDDFASQWLQLYRLSGVIPDSDVFSNFTEDLRQDMERETKLFLGSVLREDRSVVDLLTANYTFLNERLAQHYQIPGVYGERFRRVTLGQERGGLLGHGSMLTLTSYPTRTSPVLRGKWLLDNILGTPPPAPPANVPPLDEEKQRVTPLSQRERMEQHRKNPVCATCHKVIDPLGFSLENFDAIGRFRAVSESGAPIDTAGKLADGTKIEGPPTLREALSRSPENFAMTVTEKLLTYALGREVDYQDRPAIRTIIREAARDNYRWSAIILNIVKSLPFQLRRSES